MGAPFFSIIIPTLNEEVALPHLLQDLEGQSFSDFEVCVVDGESDDNTQHLVKKLEKKDHRFSLLCSKRSNVATQRNLGASYSHSERLLFLDADVRLSPQFLQKVARKIEREKPDACTFATVSSNTKMQFKLLLFIADCVYFCSTLFRHPFCWGAMLFSSRDAFDAIKGFDESAYFMEDSYFAQDIGRAGFSFRFFWHPTFVFSVRRYEREGIPQYFSKMFHHHINIFLHKRLVSRDFYPMNGGTMHEEDRV